MSKNIIEVALQGGIQEVISSERVQRYIDWADGNLSNALKLYALNTILSEALYTPLQMLEITLRNRIHCIMSNQFSENWFEQDNIITNQNQREKVKKAKDELLEDRKNITPGKMVAKLMLGFWTTMLNTEYNQLWQQHLFLIASDEGRRLSRKELARLLTKIRILRNRIAHHEPILHWNLRQHHQQILETTRWLSPVAYEWSRYHSRFDNVFPDKGIQLVT